MHRLLLKLRKRLHLERDLDDEIRQHIEMSDREFGNRLRIREQMREPWTFPFVENLARDLRHACRVLFKSPSFTLVSLFTLSLGIGINTAVFTLYDSLTYRLLPVHAPEELVRVVQQSADTVRPTSISSAEFDRMTKGLGARAEVLASSSSQTIFGTLTPDRETAEGMKTQFVTGDYFDVLGVGSARGQTFHRNDRAVAVVSYGFWTRRLSEDPGIVGRSIRLGGAEITILGVAPKGFYGTDLPPHMPDLWIPLTMQTSLLPGADWANDRTARVLHILARSGPGVTLRDIANVVKDAGGTEVGRDGRKRWLTAIAATQFQANTGAFRGTGTIGLILMGAVALVLLIGCVNLVNLTLSRNAARQQHIAVRLALGASRGRVVQQLFAENLVLGLTGGALGFGFSILLCNWIRNAVFLAMDQISSEIFAGFQLDLAPDWRVFAYTLVLSVVTAALIGIWPALGAAKAGINASLRREGLRQRQRHLLLTAQIAACFVFLAAAGLLFRGAWQSRSADPGFRTDRILGMGLDLTTLEAGSNERSVVLRRVLDRMQALPEVTSLTLVDRSPFLGTGSSNFMSDDHRRLRCRFNRVSAGYFETLGIPIIAGRAFSQAEVDRDDAEVVISEGAAKAYWPNQSPVGRHVLIDPGLRGLGQAHVAYTVVGVARNVRTTFLSKEDAFYLYFPRTVSDGGGWILMRTEHSPELAMPAAQKVLVEVNPSLASHAYLVTLEKGPIRIQKLMTDVPGMVALVLGFLALILASVGVYGVVMYLVEQRIRVIGIHMAIGAQRRDVIWLVLREGLRCVAYGTAIGLAGALGLSGALASIGKTPDLPDLTYQAGVFHPATFVVALMTLGLAVAAASILPVYRASRVDPVIALRNE
jgi:predicted permease